jgi:hypothetical protein
MHVNESDERITSASIHLVVVRFAFNFGQAIRLTCSGIELFVDITPTSSGERVVSNLKG